MKWYIQLLIAGSVLLFCSCDVIVNGTEKGGDDVTGKKPPIVTPEKFEFVTAGIFPFDDNDNWWRYSEIDGNQLDIDVTDTISDDDILYYRVSFREHRVDTTDDWFKKEDGVVMFGSSLIGMYDLFLPAKLSSKKGSFSCGSRVVDYTFYDSLTVAGVRYRKVLELRYTAPILHGFDELVLADSLGVIRMKDIDGRWPVCYDIDSCRVYGNVNRFR